MSRSDAAVAFARTPRESFSTLTKESRDSLLFACDAFVESRRVHLDLKRVRRLGGGRRALLKKSIYASRLEGRDLSLICSLLYDCEHFNKHTDEFARTHIHTHTHTRKHTHTCTCTRTCTHAYAHARAQTQTCLKKMMTSHR